MVDSQRENNVLLDNHVNEFTRDSSSHVEGANGHSILIVDDDDRIVDALSLILTREGYRILTAATGKQALEVFDKDKPDLSIIDVLLPDIDGIEVCVRAKSQSASTFQMIILMTGFAARGRRFEGLNSGADDFLSKPIDPVELLARVRSLLRTKQLYDEVEASRKVLEVRVAERTQDLRLANERLTELLQVKSNILGIVSHELRTPLMKVKSGLWLSMQEDLDADQRKLVHSMAEAACSLLEYRIADFGVITDPTDLKLQPSSVHDVLSAAIDQVKILEANEIFDLQVNVPKKLPAVVVDPISMPRAIAHLIDNAVKFGAGKPATVQIEHVDGFVSVKIQDSGIGIPEDLLNQLFAPLKQGDETSTRRHGGLGMGLALVKLILDAHDVALNIQSQPGKGTSVNIRLPVAKN